MGKEIKTSRLAVGAVLALVVAVLLGLYFASNYMLNYSIGYAEAERNSADYWRGRMKRECPWTVGWIDSVYQHRCVKDTFVIMPSGYRAHAIYLFAPKPTPNTAVVVHGISMGAATTMAVSGEPTSSYIKCFVEDCGYSGVWDEFAAQLKEQFGLPSFPLMHTTSWLCYHRYGWSFAEARQIAQVRKSTKPMLFIHGNKDNFVPFSMLRPLYDAKTKGRKAMYVAKGSVHAMAYRDHHREYTLRVKAFLE